MDVLVAFINSGVTEIVREERRAAIVGHLKGAEKGELIMFAVEGKLHHVRQIVSNPELLELRWQLGEVLQDGGEVLHSVRLYFDEPGSEPEVMRGLNAHLKVDPDQQNHEIALAEKVRVEGIEFA